MLAPIQHGVRRGLCTVRKLVTTIYEFAVSLGMPLNMEGFVFGFRNAFYKVPNAKLISKVKNVGIVSNPIQWIVHHLLETKHVIIGNCVPQT